MRDSFIAPLAKMMYENVADVPIAEKELVLEVGQYAILLMRSELSPQHYILICRKSENEYYFHDPGLPHSMLLEKGLPKFGEIVGTYGLVYMGAGIILPQ